MLIILSLSQILIGVTSQSQPRLLPGTMVTLIDLLSSTYAPVQTMILPHLAVVDVIALARTCKDFGQLQPILASTAYNVNHFLKRFVSDPIAFRSIQGACGALLSGDSVRGFLKKSKSVSAGLEVYVSKNQRHFVIDYLKKDGYTQGPDIDCNLHKKLNSDGQLLSVLLFQDDEVPIAQLFESTTVTAELNILSWNKAYSLFPYSTFIRRECFLLEELSEESVSYLNIMAKEELKTKSISWSQREATVCSPYENEPLGSLQDRDADDFGELFRRRRVGDRHTWIINLDLRDVSVPDIPTAVLESTTFRLRIPHRCRQQWQVAHYEMCYDANIRHPILRYGYVTLREDALEEDEVTYDDFGGRLMTSYYSRKCQDLSTRLDELTIIELTKIVPDQRPPEHAELTQHVSRAARTRDKFDLPSTWTFYDDEVIAYLDKAWKVQQTMDAQEESSRKLQFNRAVIKTSVE